MASYLAPPSVPSGTRADFSDVLTFPISAKDYRRSKYLPVSNLALIFKAWSTKRVSRPSRISGLYR